MSLTEQTASPLLHADRFFIGGEWVTPSSDAVIRVTDSSTEQVCLTVPEAVEPDMTRAAAAARRAFDRGPWPRLTHAQRAGYLRAIAAGIRQRSETVGDLWPREAGVLFSIARCAGAGAADVWEYYANLAETFTWKEPATPAAGEFGLWCASRSAWSGRSSPGTAR